MALTRTALRGLGLLLAAVALAALHLPGRPRTFCLLRTCTGLPCPLCGGTTAAVDVGHADLLAGLRASPLAVLGACAFVLSPAFHTLVRRPSLTVAQRWSVIASVAVAAELWQLDRFHLL